MIKNTYHSIIKFLISNLSNDSKNNLALNIIGNYLHNSDSVEGYRFRRRIFNRFFKSYPMLFSHEAQRIYGFFNIFKSLKNVEGDIVECGVGRGSSICVFAYANEFFDLNKKIYGFDSFEGFPDVHKKDVSINARAKELGSIPGWDDFSENLIYHALEDDPINGGPDSLFKEKKANIKLIKGFFSNTLEKNLPESISFLHLDADLYESTYDSLLYCIPRLTKGALIVFDELHEEVKWPGVKKAVEELCIPKGLVPIWSPELLRYYIVNE